MTTTPAKTTQQEQWVLVHNSYVLPSARASLVRISGGDNAPRSVAVKNAMSNPANVLNVDAYPGSVEAFIEICHKIAATKGDRASLIDTVADISMITDAALASIHPAPAAKEAEVGT